MKSPLVSIILPTHNREKLIKRSITTVLNQTYKNFELIVVDDASTDRTAESVKAFDDPRIRYVCLARNSGAGAARNYGIQIARADYIAFQDSDDEWLPDKLEKQMWLICQTDDIDVVYTDMQRISTDGSVNYHCSPTFERGRLIDPATQFYQPYDLGIQATVIKKACLQQVGCFDERFNCLEDLELFIRLSMKYKFYHIQEPLVNYYETDGVSKNMRAEYEARKLLLKKYASDLMHHKAFYIKEYAEVSRILMLKKTRAALESFYNKLFSSSSPDTGSAISKNIQSIQSNS